MAAGRFKTINRDAAYLMPPSVQDWLPEGHLARFVVEIIDDLDLSVLERQYSGRGKDAYHPAAMLGLLVYGYATGVFSSRQLERATYESVAFRFVAGNEHPDHDTLANFRRRFLPQLEGLFVQVLVLAQAMGLLKLGKLSVDGIMPSPDGGFVQAYNAQAGVDVDTHLVVSAHLSQAPNDKREIEPALERLAALEGVLGKPEALLADSGYFSQANVEACARQDITPYLCEKRERHNRPLAERLDSTCPPPPPEGADALTQMRHRLATPEGKAVYAKRKSTVETVFGIIKQVLGFRQFQLRGLAGARGEWNLVCLAWNLKRMHALVG